MDNYNYDELFIIRDDFISFLRDKNYKDSTLYDIKNDINGLLKFLIDNSLLIVILIATPYCTEME